MIMTVLSVLSTLSAPGVVTAQQRAVAVTFDDLPIATRVFHDIAAQEHITTALLTTHTLGCTARQYRDISRRSPAVILLCVVPELEPSLDPASEQVYVVLIDSSPSAISFRSLTNPIAGTR